MALLETKTKKVKMKLTKFQKHLLIKALTKETDRIQLVLQNNNCALTTDSIEDLLFQYMEIYKQINK